MLQSRRRYPAKELEPAPVPEMEKELFNSAIDKKHLAIAAGILMLVIAVLCRYKIVPVAGYAYKLDRWTGDVFFIAGPNQKEVSEVKPALSDRVSK